MLNRYDMIPDDVKNASHHLQNAGVDTEASINIAYQDPQRTPGSVRSQYLFNQRWVWSVASAHNLTINANNIAQMLEAITKYVLCY